MAQLVNEERKQKIIRSKQSKFQSQQRDLILQLIKEITFLNNKRFESYLVVNEIRKNVRIMNRVGIQGRGRMYNKWKFNNYNSFINFQKKVQYEDNIKYKQVMVKK
ncbi:unnamed protein product [Paramecium sonneborni]|uniref:Uncharacterized protein n=1 Tax=Paramecium sonneborni TaxID=65129 RepID=A0A8S1ML88_9CILI|nr:unnamed protein product [Paramecium sonneborni]